jgi:hypothetical protein
MTSDLWLIPKLGGGLTVTLGETSLAGFYGPNARQLAESHRDLLIAALTPRRRRLRHGAAPAAGRKSRLSRALFKFSGGSVVGPGDVIH